jgi:RNA polymerase sigma factor (sigma-70 family)
MRNTLFDGYEGPRLPREVQLKRLRRVIEAELTPCQRQTLISYYFRQMTIPQIAEERGVNKSTVSRTLQRAEARVRRCLRY